MNTILLFLVKSIVVSGLFTTWYWFGLRKTKLYQYNRAFLLFTLYASIQLPLLHFHWFIIDTPAPATGGEMPMLVQLVADGSTPPAQGTVAPYTSLPGWDTILLTVAALVSLVLLTRLVINIISVVRMARRYPTSFIDGITVVHTDIGSAPFSFFRSLFWNDAVPMSSPGGQIMLRHEQAHIRQLHSVDKLVSQVVTCLFWMNPFYWLIRRELEMTHEFIADSGSVAGGDTASFAAMLLTAHCRAAHMAPQHSFFSSPIKRRLTMLNNTKKTSHAWLRRLAVVPCLTAALLAFSFAPVPKNAAAPDAKKIVLMENAGHGGNDAGASYNGYTEKDITLQIANRLKELAPGHNVEVQLTRSDDNYVILNDRVKMSNKVAPDAFISLHVANDKTADVSTQQFDLGIILASGSTSTSKSMALGRNVYAYALQMKDMKKAGKWYKEMSLAVLRENNAPCLLIELGDIKNKNQMDRLANSGWRDALCNAILNGVVASAKH